MDFLNKNKNMIIQVLVGIAIAIVLDILRVPTWIIGGVIAGVITLVTGPVVKMFDEKLAPKLEQAADKTESAAREAADKVEDVAEATKDKIKDAID